MNLRFLLSLLEGAGNSQLCCTVPYCAMLHCTMLYYTVQCCTALHYDALYYTVLFCASLKPPLHLCKLLYDSMAHCQLFYLSSFSSLLNYYSSLQLQSLSCCRSYITYFYFSQYISIITNHTLTYITLT